MCEHTHMPSDHTSWPPGDEDRFISHLWDPFIALSFVAATTDLAIGTAVALPVQHDPIVLAKEVATLDRLSGGRLTLGFGWGWNREEVANHGYPPAARVAVMAEKLALMKSLWTEEETTFDGTYLHMAPSSSRPKPLQKPHPPILLGVPGNARNFARIAAWADGWIPHASPLLEPGFPAQLDEARETWQGAGHDPDRFDVTIMQLPETTDRLASGAGERPRPGGAPRVVRGRRSRHRRHPAPARRAGHAAHLSGSLGRPLSGAPWAGPGGARQCCSG